MADLKHIVAQRVHAGRMRLPVLPQVATQVLALARDDRSTSASLTELIHRDQALAAHVLRTANSAAFAARVPIASLQQAVTHLGLRTLVDIVMTVCVRDEIFEASGFDDYIRELWQFSLATGMLAREIARIQHRDTDSAYLCGLLHEIGKPIVLREAADVGRRKGEQRDLAEIGAVVEALHARVGRMAARRWKLPARIQTAIVHHASYQRAQTDADAAMMTNLASHLARHLLHPDQLDDEALRALPVLADLQVEARVLQELRDTGVRLLEDVDAVAA